MKRDMNQNSRIWLLLLLIPTLVVVTILAALWAVSAFWHPAPLEPWEPWDSQWARQQNIPGDIAFFYIAETVISTINVTLSIFLFATYIIVYEKTGSEFTIGLIIFSAVFFLNALVSNPFVIWIFGYRPVGLGPFALLPDIFTLAALAILLYLSIKY